MATVASESSAAAELKIVQDATCTFCGCVCDDIDLKVQDNHIVEVQAGLRPRQGVVFEPRD